MGLGCLIFTVQKLQTEERSVCEHYAIGQVPKGLPSLAGSSGSRSSWPYTVDVLKQVVVFLQDREWFKRSGNAKAAV